MPLDRYQLTRPPEGLDEVVAALGDPGPYRDPRAQLVWAGRTQEVLSLPFTVQYIGAPVRTIVVHRRLLHAFGVLFRDLHAAGLGPHVQEFGGTYSFAAKDEAPAQFAVSTWAAAIRFNASTVQAGGQDNQHPGVVDAFARCGFVRAGWACWQFVRGY